MQILPRNRGNTLTFLPRHYLEQFHVDYNPAIDELVAKEGFTDWAELFSSKAGPEAYWGSNPDLPTLGAWRLVTPFGEGQQVTLERNPYYWKTDPEGRQLPYLDNVTFDIVSDLEVMLLKGLNGELDLEVPPRPRITIPDNKPVLAQNRERGRYRFVDAAVGRGNIVVIQLNLTHADQTKREIFRNKDFRIGLSHALNRQEIIDVAMHQQGEPYQVAPLPDSAFYHEELATQYLDYDLDLANEYLDKAFPDRDGDGFRLGPDGRPITITMDFATGFRTEWDNSLELVKNYWREVGVDLILNPLERTLFVERTGANLHEASIWHDDGGLAAMLSPHNVVPVVLPRYGIAWWNWYRNGPEPKQEPPEPVKTQMELYRRIASTPDPDEQTQLFMSVLDIAAEQFYVIGIAREVENYFIAANNFHNLPEVIISGWDYQTPGPTNPEQYFIDIATK